MAAAAAASVAIHGSAPSPGGAPVPSSHASHTVPPPGLLLAAAHGPALPARAAAAGLPRYYATLDEGPPAHGPLAARVHDAATGATLATVPLPRGADPKLSLITSGGSNGTFIVALDSDLATRFYRLQTAPDGRAARLAPLHLPSLPPGSSARSIALSPDGSRLAVALEYSGPADRTAVEILPMTPGSPRTWPAPGPGFLQNLSWSDSGRDLIFSWLDDSRAGGDPRTAASGLWLLDTTAPATGLLSGRRIIPASVGGDDIQSAVLSPGGRTVLASVTYDGPSRIGRGTVVGGIVELSARTGQPVRTLLAEHASYNAAGPGQRWYIGACQLIDADRTGQHLLVSCDGFGRLDRGRFTPLPGGPPQRYAIAAW